MVYVYDSVDQSVYNAASDTSVNEIFAVSSHSNGISDMIIRPKVYEAFLLENLRKTGLEDDIKISVEGGFSGLRIKEKMGFDPVTGAGVYQVTYDYPLIGGLDPVQLTHKVRVKSIWQSTDDEHETDHSDNGNVMRVYTSTHGRENKIYHDNPECWTLKKSWETPDSIRIHDKDDLENYRACKVCKKNE